MLPFAALDAPPERVAILGNAAGTTARALRPLLPATRVDGVEIDGELTRARAARWFDLRNPRLRGVPRGRAARTCGAPTARYDVIMVDAYRQPYIPFYLATREFFELARDRLQPGGVVVVNAGHPEGQDDLEKVLGATMADVFPTVLRDPSEDTNTLLLGTDGAGVGARGCARAVRRAAAGPAAAARWPRPARLAPAPRGRQRLHRRQGAGRVADRQVHRRLRRRREVSSDEAYR